MSIRPQDKRIRLYCCEVLSLSDPGSPAVFRCSPEIEQKNVKMDVISNDLYLQRGVSDLQLYLLTLSKDKRELIF